MKDSEKNKAAAEAVALAYDPVQSGPPTVIAAGKGNLADELVRLAVQHGIPVKFDPDLVQVLSRLDVGEDLPEELFVVVAELLAFIYRVNMELFGGKT